MTSLRAQLVRWLLIAVTLVVLYSIAKRQGFLDELTVEGVRALLRRAEPWGMLAYLLIYCCGVLLSIPGLVFIVAGMIAFGPAVGIPLTLFSSVVAGSLAVWFLQKVGGSILRDSDHPHIRRTVDLLHARPIRTIATLRIFLMISPVLNIPLAMAGVRVRDNAIGTAVGIIPAVLVVALATDLILALLKGAGR